MKCTIVYGQELIVIKKCETPLASEAVKFQDLIDLGRILPGRGRGSFENVISLIFKETTNTI